MLLPTFRGRLVFSTILDLIIIKFCHEVGGGGGFGCDDVIMEVLRLKFGGGVSD